MTIYRKVKVSDRLPGAIREVFYFLKDGTKRIGYCISNDAFSHSKGRDDVSKIDYWVEEIELPTIINIRDEAAKDTELDGYFEELAFEKGANYILNKIKGG